MDLRKVEKIGRGFKVKCKFPRCGNSFIAYRKTARYCPKCRKLIKSMLDENRNRELSQKRSLKKIPKGPKDKNYEKFIDDVSDAVVMKILAYL